MECGHKFTMCRLCLCESESFSDIFQLNELFDYVAAEVITDLLHFEVELRPVKMEPILDTQNSQQEIRKCNIACTSLEYLSCHPNRTCSESYGLYESSVEDNGKPLLKERKNVAFDANPGENGKSSGSTKVNVVEMYVKVRKNCKSLANRIDMLPVEKNSINRVESTVEELRREMIERRKDVNCVDTSMEVILEDEGMLKLNLESDRYTERGEEILLGVNGRGRKRECFRCNECGKNFEKKDLLIRHLELHGYEVDKESCSEDGDIQVHNNVSSGSKNNNNEVHKKGLKGKISDKVKRDEGVKKYVCDTCGKGFTSIGLIKTHLRIHSGEKPFACAVCGKRFSDKSNLRTHEFRHTGEKPYTCEVCSKRFAQNGQLKRHREIHNDEKPYVCEMCGKKFISRYKLIIHWRLHSGERPYVCEICSKRFTQSSILKAHRRIHSDEKPYVCDVCGKKFGLSSSLKKHGRVHSGERPYVCKVCDKCFRDSSTLSRHLKIHLRNNHRNSYK